MTNPLDEVYFEWLLDQIGLAATRNPARSYRALAGLMFHTDFRCSLALDDNRAEDGKELRELFIRHEGLTFVTNDWMDIDCSVLELLVALARMGTFESEVSPEEWFYIFLTNLGLLRYTDAVYDQDHVANIDEILTIFMDRTYGPLGEGGLFPLRGSHPDQRRVELWYQMAAYILERY